MNSYPDQGQTSFIIDGKIVPLGGLVRAKSGADLTISGIDQITRKLICTPIGTNMKIPFSLDEISVIEEGKPCKPVITVQDAIIEACSEDKGERLKDCINNLLRQAAMGEEWATKLLFEKLDNEHINNK